MLRGFCVWAPRPREVELLLPDGRHPMTRDENDWWHACANVEPGSPYAFSLDGGDPRPDPQGLQLPDGPHGWSKLYDPDEYVWSDGNWTGVSKQMGKTRSRGFELQGQANVNENVSLTS